jgi:hypothetical protein
MQIDEKEILIWAEANSKGFKINGVDRWVNSLSMELPREILGTYIVLINVQKHAETKVIN